MRIMKKLFITFLFLALLCTGCMPAGYSQQQQNSVTSAHSGEAKQWFADHMPSAEVLSAKAYADGLDLYSLITGKYRENGSEYLFFYDYNSGEMYLGRPFLEAEEYAKKELADALGISISQMRFYPAEWRIYATSEDDRDPNQYPNASVGMIETTGVYVLPADADPEEYGKKMVREGLDNGAGSTLSKSGAFIYVDTIPAYDPVQMEFLAGMSYLDLIQPADADFEGLCEAVYSSGQASYVYLHLESYSGELSAGYTYQVTDLYDKGGNVRMHTSDISAAEDMGMKMDADGLSFHIPKGAEPLVLAVKGKYHFQTTDGKGDPLVINWYEEKSSGNEDYLGDPSLMYFSRMVFPNDGRCVYTITPKSDRTEYNFK